MQISIVMLIFLFFGPNFRRGKVSEGVTCFRQLPLWKKARPWPHRGYRPEDISYCIAYLQIVIKLKAEDKFHLLFRVAVAKIP